MKSRNKKLFAISMLVFSGLFLFLALGWFSYLDNSNIVKIKGRRFFVELAQKPEEHSLGLGNRDYIKENSGMLFIFQKSKKTSFWMKNMKFDLDILWIEEGKIVYIAKNIKYDHEGIISPGVNADKVLEITAGTCDKYDFKVGDPVYFRFKSESLFR